MLSGMSWPCARKKASGLPGAVRRTAWYSDSPVASYRTLDRAVIVDAHIARGLLNSGREWDNIFLQPRRGQRGHVFQSRKVTYTSAHRIDG